MSVGRMNRIEDLDGNPLWDKDLGGILGNVTTSTGTQTVAEALDERVNKGEVGQELVGPTPYLELTSRLVNDVANGLEITPFHFGGGEPQAGVDDSPRLKDAIEFCFGTLEVPGLNLAGRGWRLKESVAITMAAGASRRIHNGRLVAEPDFSGGYLLDFRPNGDDVPGNRLQGLTIDNIGFTCGVSGDYRASGAIVVDKAQGVYLNRLGISNFSQHGVLNLTERAAVELFVTTCIIGSSAENTSGIRSLGFDSEYRDLIVRNTTRGLDFTRSGNIVKDSHIYGCTEAAVRSATSIASVSGSYIDNCPIILGSLQNSSIVDNKFLNVTSDSAVAGSSFIQLNQNSSSEVRAVSIIGNHFNNITGADCDSLSFTGTGAIPFIRHFTMKDNGFNNVTPRYSHPTLRSNSLVSPGTSVSADFSTLIPFGEVVSHSAVWNMATGSSSVPAIATRVEGSNNNEVTANLSANATGSALISANINASPSD